MKSCEVEHVIVVRVCQCHTGQQLHSSAVLHKAHLARNHHQLWTVVIDSLNLHRHIHRLTPEQPVKNPEHNSGEEEETEMVIISCNLLVDLATISPQLLAVLTYLLGTASGSSDVMLNVMFLSIWINLLSQL